VSSFGGGSLVSSLNARRRFIVPWLFGHAAFFLMNLKAKIHNPKPGKRRTELNKATMHNAPTLGSGQEVEIRNVYLYLQAPE
jgi:hypothetical protein